MRHTLLCAMTLVLLAGCGETFVDSMPAPAPIAVQERTDAATLRQALVAKLTEVTKSGQSKMAAVQRKFEQFPWFRINKSRDRGADIVQVSIDIYTQGEMIHHALFTDAQARQVPQDEIQRAEELYQAWRRPYDDKIEDLNWKVKVANKAQELYNQELCSRTDLVRRLREVIESRVRVVEQSMQVLKAYSDPQ